MPVNPAKPVTVSRTRSRLTLGGVFLFVLMAACYDYPPLWDRPADFLSNRLLQRFTSWRIPHFRHTPFRLGLDLQGGTHLVYEADVSNVIGSPADAMEGVRDVIERRVNLFGVAEPVVEVNRVGSRWRLIVELAGVKNIEDAIKQIGETPLLEFRRPREEAETGKILEIQGTPTSTEFATYKDTDPYFAPTELNGRFLKRAAVEFDQNTYTPTVGLEFTNEGAEIFEKLTEQYLKKPIAIYLDGVAISTPVVQNVIAGGRAQITGNFSLKEANKLAERLNAGALPVPIKLVAQESVGAALGAESVARSLRAGIAGFMLVALFMILWYRLPGLGAAIALSFYVVTVLFIFKLIPVTLTLAGIAGFILSIGFAVDANVLIFERMREEFRRGFGFGQGILEGFRRAWPSIRDSNVSTFITALILFWLGTSVVKGFALTLIIGILISLLSAISVTRTMLLALVGTPAEKLPWLFLRPRKEGALPENPADSAEARRDKPAGGREYKTR